MKHKIETMTLNQVQVFKKQISLSSAPRETKTELYEECEKREKQLDLSTATVVKARTDK